METRYTVVHGFQKLALMFSLQVDPLLDQNLVFLSILRTWPQGRIVVGVGK